MKQTNNYQAPDMETIKISTTSVLCESGPTPGSGNEYEDIDLG